MHCKFQIQVTFFKIIILGLLLALFSMPTNAYSINETVIVSGDSSVFYIDGKITKDTWGRFVDNLLKIKTVELNSPGGYVIYAEAMARLIRKRGITTKVRKNNGCFSACVLIFQSGTKRIAHKTAVFMMHPVTINVKGVDIQDKWSTNRLWGWLMKMGLKVEVANKLKTGKDEYFGAKEALKYGVATEIED